MAYTGLRAGEVAGLRVRDIDLAAGHVSVWQTAQHIKGEWVYGTPKSRRSTRDVPLLDRKLIADLKRALRTFGGGHGVRPPAARSMRSR